MINFGSAAPLYPAIAIANLTIGVNSSSTGCSRFIPRPGRAHEPATQGARSKDNSIVLDVQGMRVAVRTDAGEGPVLVDDVSLQLKRGEVIGLIGESAPASRRSASPPWDTRAATAISSAATSSWRYDIRAISMDERRALRGPKIAYIAQSAAASFNPAHTLMEQVCEASVRHGVLSRAEARAEAISLFSSSICRAPRRSAHAIRIRFPADSSSA